MEGGYWGVRLKLTVNRIFARSPGRGRPDGKQGRGAQRAGGGSQAAVRRLRARRVDR